MVCSWVVAHVYGARYDRMLTGVATVSFEAAGFHAARRGRAAAGDLFHRVDVARAAVRGRRGLSEDDLGSPAEGGPRLASGAAAVLGGCAASARRDPSCFTVAAGANQPRRLLSANLVSHREPAVPRLRDAG